MYKWHNQFQPNPITKGIIIAGQIAEILAVIIILTVAYWTVAFIAN